MANPAATAKKIPLTPLVVGVVVILTLIAGFTYLTKPVAQPAEGRASAEAGAYLANLELTDVGMQATENFMQQQVVEVQGKIGNKGPRSVASIDVYCLFYGIDGREIHRERLPIVGKTGAKPPLQSGDTRAFRLPFDSLPDGWNQAMPKLVIAQIAFAN